MINRADPKTMAANQAEISHRFGDVTVSLLGCYIFSSLDTFSSTV